MWIPFLENKKTGKELYFVPLYIAPKLKKMYIGKPIAFDADAFLSQMSELMAAAYENSDDICSRVQSIVTTYHPAANHH